MLTYLYSLFTPYEWLLTNKKGGYALGTAFLANIRKYHGLLIGGYESEKRFHLLSNVEEKVLFPSGLEYFLDTNFYSDIIYPQGYIHIKEFFFKPYPQFFYICPKNKEFFLKKSLRMSENKNALLISYQNISSYPYKLFIRPKVTFRNHHQLTSQKEWQDYILESNSESAFLSKGEFSLFFYINQGRIILDPLFYYRVYYPLEELRGYLAMEDQFSPLLMEVELAPGETWEVLFSDQFISSLEKEISDIKERYRNLPQLSLKSKSFKEEEYYKILKEMVKDFWIKGDVIAGYPWFYCWGRDTFIGLPALFYLEEGFSQSLEIFETYIKRLYEGLIPNLYSTPEETNYNSIDSTLWFLLRLFEFLEFFKEKIDTSLEKRFLKIVEEILEQFFTNYSLPFYVDWEDGLLEIPETVNLALTWMDVMIDGKPLTPRYGKPIEISFLWHNVLFFSEKKLNPKILKHLKIKELLEKQKIALQKYFGEKEIADRLFKGKPIFEVRPNFVIALGLPFTPVSEERLKQAQKLAEEELLTPYGLRSLSPKHPAYKRKYFGNQYQRDLSYHNGTVWVWLLYPYGNLLEKLLSPKEYYEALKKLLHPFRELIFTGKIGSLPELYDGDNPYYPKGAPAQFWSVAAIFLLEQKFLQLREIK